MSDLDIKGAHELLLQMLDAQYQRIRAIHADARYINDNEVYKETLAQFAYIQTQIFRFKQLWDMLASKDKRNGHS